MSMLCNELPILIIDIQGFQYKAGQFIPKEMAALCLHTNQHVHYVFQPPYPFSSLTRREKMHYYWLEENYHGGLKWKDGYIQLSKLTYILQHICEQAAKGHDGKLPKDVLIICKGAMKKTFLQSCLNGNVVVNLDDHHKTFPSLRTSNTPMCLEHLYNYGHCALANVYIINKCISNLSNTTFNM